MRKRDIYYDHNTMYQILFYKFVKDKKNYQIAKKTGVSQSTVAEYLDIAREQGFYKVFIDFAPESEVATNLMINFGLRDVVLSSSKFGLKELALLGARFFAKEILKDNTSVTVGGGTNIWELVGSLPTLNKKNVDIYSMCFGDHFLAEISSSMVANVLFFRLYKHDARLNIFPDSGKLEFSTPSKDSRIYKAACDADVFLVPFGSLEAGTGKRVVVEEFHLDLDELKKKGVVGFCGYHLITEDGEHFPVKMIEERVLSIGLEHLRKAAHTEGKFVIGVGAGVEKASLIRAALRKGYVNTLIIDDAIAKALLEGEK